MCAHGTDVMMPVIVPAYLSHTGQERVKSASIDACIAPLVKALNDGGVQTIQSCCGHGKGQGRIDLSDGRVLFVDKSDLPHFAKAEDEPK